MVSKRRQKLESYWTKRYSTKRPSRSPSLAKLPAMSRKSKATWSGFTIILLTLNEERCATGLNIRILLQYTTNPVRIMRNILASGYIAWSNGETGFDFSAGLFGFTEYLELARLFSHRISFKRLLHTVKSKKLIVLHVYITIVLFGTAEKSNGMKQYPF